MAERGRRSRPCRVFVLFLVVAACTSTSGHADQRKTAEKGKEGEHWPWSTTNKLANSKLRFGANGAAVTAQGDLKQPMAYAMGRWNKLTYGRSSYSTKFKVNGNLISLSPARTTYVSNLKVTTDQTFSGGTLKRTYEFTDGNTGMIEMTYQFCSGNAVPLENMELWIGIRDDYVGNDDTPDKEIGTLDNGQFLPKTSVSDANPGDCLRVSAGNGIGVYFFSNSGVTRGVIASCCSFNNVLRVDKDNWSVLSQFNRDGSYGLYGFLGNEGANTCFSYALGYAAGALSELQGVLATREPERIAQMDRQCTCENGTPAVDASCPSRGAVACSACGAGSHLSGITCLPNVCQCNNGVGKAGTACTTHGAILCASCEDTYTLVADICEPPPPCTGPVCVAGQFEASPCPTRSCQPCKTSCSAGQFLVGECDGLGSTDPKVCQACTTSCSSGMYVTAPCDGTATENTASCASCKTVASCAGGTYLEGSCSGQGHEDSTECVACSEHCGAEGCDGPSASDCIACRLGDKRKPIAGCQQTDWKPFTPAVQGTCQGVNQPQGDGGCNSQCSPLPYYVKEVGCCRNEAVARAELASCDACQKTDWRRFTPVVQGTCQGVNQPHGDGGCNSQCSPLPYYDSDIGCFRDEVVARAELASCASALPGRGAGPASAVYECVSACTGNLGLEFEGICTHECPEGTVEHEGTCLPGCPGSLLVSEKKCVERCPAATYADMGEGACVACHDQCSERPTNSYCVGPNPSDCTSCKGVRLVAEGACVEECPDNMFEFKEGTEEPRCQSCTSCAAGTHITAECGTDLRPDGDTVCAPCTTACAVHEYLSGPCDGTTMVDRSACNPCRSSCASGHFIYGTCDGHGRRDITICTPCRAECSGFTFLAGFCSGTTFGDTTSCEPCDAVCSDGGCHGAGPTDCLHGCRHVGIMGDDSTVECVEECPLPKALVLEPRVVTDDKLCVSECPPFTALDVDVCQPACPAAKPYLMPQQPYALGTTGPAAPGAATLLEIDESARSQHRRTALRQKHRTSSKAHAGHLEKWSYEDSVALAAQGITSLVAPGQQAPPGGPTSDPDAPKAYGVCVADCGNGYFVDMGKGGVCIACNAECDLSLPCSGPGAHECHRCAHFYDQGLWALATENKDCSPTTDWKGLQTVAECSATCSEQKYFISVVGGDSNCKCADDCTSPRLNDASGFNVYQQDGASCTDTGLLITSHRNQQLEDRDGGAGLNGDTGSWQEWTIKKSTGSKFYITSHRNQQLEDRDGNVGLHGDKGSWQEWTIEKLDNTKFLITSHRNQQLEDRDGRVGMNGDNAAWQQWTIVSTEGLSPCLHSNLRVCDDLKPFTPTVEGTCQGASQTPGDGGCNSQCGSLGGFFRGDLGGCVTDYCACPTKEACADSWFGSHCGEQCNGFIQPAVVSSCADGRKDSDSCLQSKTLFGPQDACISSRAYCTDTSQLARKENLIECCPVTCRTCEVPTPAAECVAGCPAGRPLMNMAESPPHCVKACPAKLNLHEGTCIAECPEDRPVSEDEECVEACSNPNYATADTEMICQPCDAQCSTAVSGVQCVGAGPANCTACANVEEERTLCKSQCNAGNWAPDEGDDRSCSECATCQTHENIAAVCTPSTDTVCGPCLAECGAGEFIEGICDGSDLHVDPTTCQPCLSICGPGLYLEGACDGLGRVDVVGCVPCRTECAEGRRRTAVDTCDGLQHEDTVECADCTTSCGVGEYLVGFCDGHSIADEVYCQGCKTACPLDYYLSGICPGTERIDSTQCLQCHEECTSGDSGCSGPGPKTCGNCKHQHHNAEGCVPLCPEDRKLDVEGECVDKCPQKTVRWDDKEAAQGTQAFWCLEHCPGSHPFVSVVLGKCVEECEAGYYPNPADGVCTPCDSECLTGCSGGSNADCDGECAHVRDGVACLAVCPGGKWAKERGEAVPICAPCTMCPAGGFTASLCTPTSDTECGDCTSVCEAGNFLVGSCPGDGREDDVRCDSCQTACPAFHWLEGHCSGLAKVDDTKCRVCDGECAMAAGCSGPGDGNCRECAHVRDGAVCLASCPAERPLMSEFTCVAECPDGTFRHDVAPLAASEFEFEDSLAGEERESITEKIDRESKGAGSYGSYGPDEEGVDCSDAACNGVRSPLKGLGEYCAEGWVCCLVAPGIDNPSCTAPPCWSKGDACPLATPSSLAMFLQVESSIAQGAEREIPGPPMAIGECVSSCPESHPYIEVDHCVKECALGEFADPEAGLCSKCDPQCGEDAGCEAAGPTGCKACRAKVDDDVCVAQCPMGKFAVESETECRVCHTCGEGSFVFGDCDFKEDMQCHTCKDKCEEGAYMAGFCDGNGVADAVECLECTAFCPDGFYKEGHCGGQGREDGVGCVACDGMCGADGCKGAGPTACVTCKHVLNVDKCVEECSSDVLRPLILDEEDGAVCVAVCPEGLRALDGECLSGCPDEKEPYILEGPHNATCVDECPEGQFASEENVCVPCDAECEGDCIGAGPSSCDRCAHVQLGHVCVAECPEDTWIDDKTGKCSVCSVCASGTFITAACTDTADITCEPCKVKCDEDFFMAGECTGADVTDTVTCRTCTAECGMGHFLDGHCTGESVTNDVVCTLCSPECEAAAGCNGVGTDLTACNACAFARDEQNCVLECLDKKPLRSLGECVASCPDPTMEHMGDCVSDCPDTHPYVSGGKCVEACASNEFADDESVCAPCHEQCQEECTGPTDADCVGGCANAFNDDRCIAECPDDKWKDADTTCEFCSSCGEGSFVKSACDKTKADTVCAKCTEKCTSGSYMKGTCDGSDDHDAIECVGCTSDCGEGSYLTGECDGTGVVNAAECKACSACNWGDWIEKICSPTTDTVCKTCRSTCPKKGMLIDDETRCDGTQRKDTTKCVKDDEDGKDCKDGPCGPTSAPAAETVVLVSSSVATADDPEDAKKAAVKDAKMKLSVLEGEKIGAGKVLGVAGQPLKGLGKALGIERR